MSLDLSNFGSVIDDGRPADQISPLLQQQAQVSAGLGQKAQVLADPFSAYKPAVAGALSKLLSNPGDITTSPNYAFGRDQGIEAVIRANKGVDSGRYMADLLKFGTGYAGQQFNSLAGLYNHILGGSSVGGAQMLMGGFGRSQDQQALAAAGRQAGQAAQPGGGAKPFNVADLMQKYGGANSMSSFNPNASSAFNAGQFGLPSGGYSPSSTGGYDAGMAGRFNSPESYDPSTGFSPTTGFGSITNTTDYSPPSYDTNYDAGNYGGGYGAFGYGDY